MVVADIRLKSRREPSGQGGGADTPRQVHETGGGYDLNDDIPF
ncbi:hypothetical protein [Brevundimonas sp.]